MKVWQTLYFKKLFNKLLYTFFCGGKIVAFHICNFEIWYRDLSYLRKKKNEYARTRVGRGTIKLSEPDQVYPATGNLFPDENWP